jgi:membrane-bound serine protease (ClpP class)
MTYQGAAEAVIRRGFQAAGVSMRLAVLAWLLAVCGVRVPVLAQEAPATPPTPAPTPATTPPPVAAKPDRIQQAKLAGSGLISKNVAILTLDREIDRTTAVSIKRRIKAAEAAGADAIVIELNTPGGELGAVREIASALSTTSVSRTIAWVNTDAYSGGAIIALACKEIVVADGSALGDAAPIAISPLAGLKPLPATERSKILAPLLGTVVDLARRNGYDERMVQGMVALGVELWLVDNPSTGQRLLIDRAEYSLLFDTPPPVQRPRIVTGGPAPSAAPADSGVPKPSSPDKSARTSPSTSFPPSAGGDFKPATSSVRPQDVTIAQQYILTPSQRLTLSATDRGQWRLVEYVTDGTGILTLNADELLRYSLARAKINSQAELEAYLQATNVQRLEFGWHEKLAIFLSSIWIRGLLVVLIVLGLFIEFIHPGLILPGAVAGLAIVLLVMPGILLGLAGWWPVVGIVAGIVLILTELFIFPGLIIPGTIGLVMLFGGLVMSFVPSGEAIFPGSGPSTSQGILWGIAFVLLGIVSCGVVGYALHRAGRSLPVFRHLVLAGSTGVAAEEEALSIKPARGAMETATIQTAGGMAQVSLGATGTTITPLRPAGKVDFDGVLLDVVAESAYVDAGTPVRVVTIDGLRLVVERIS